MFNMLGIWYRQKWCYRRSHALVKHQRPESNCAHHLFSNMRKSIDRGRLPSKQCHWKTISHQIITRACQYTKHAERYRPSGIFSEPFIEPYIRWFTYHMRFSVTSRNYKWEKVNKHVIQTHRDCSPDWRPGAEQRRRSCQSGAQSRCVWITCLLTFSHL